MGSPLSVDLAGIFMTKLEKEIVYPVEPILYRRFVDDSHARFNTIEGANTFTDVLYQQNPKIQCKLF